MSYILDALRKSDQLRLRGAAPTLLLGQATATAPRQPARIYYAVLALVLLCAGIAIGWLRPWQAEPAVPPPGAIAANPPATGQSRVPAAGPEVQPKPELQVRNTVSATLVAPAPAPVSAGTQPPAPVVVPAQQPDEADLRIEKRSAPPKAKAAPSTKAARPVPAQTAGINAPGASNAAAAPLAKVVAFSELPLAVQQEIPPLSISVHAYSSNSAERLVGINGRLLHEGDTAAPGLQLEQITPEGMVLSYKGYSFRRGVH